MSETKIGDIIKPGQPVRRTALERLRQLWVETYIGLMLITSKTENKALRYMKDKLVEANDAVIGFIDGELEEKRRWSDQYVVAHSN